MNIHDALAAFLIGVILVVAVHAALWLISSVWAWYARQLRSSVERSTQKLIKKAKNKRTCEHVDTNQTAPIPL